MRCVIERRYKKMKKYFLQRVTVTNLLIASYCGLLVIVALIRFREYQDTRQALSAIDAISKTTNQKQALLLHMSEGYAHAHENIPTAAATIDATGTAGSKRDLFSAPESDSILAAYQTLIRSDTEKQLFNELLRLQSTGRQAHDLVLPAYPGKNVAGAHSHNGNQQLQANPDFNTVVHKLQHLVGEASQQDIANASQGIISLARRREMGSYVVITLMLILGLAIGFALRKLRRTENKYRLLFDNSTSAKFLVDPNGFRILDLNHAAVALYGYSRKELLQMKAFDLRRVDDEMLESLESEFQQYIKAGSAFSAQAKHYKKNNETIDVEISSNSIFAGDKPVLLVTIRDITEQEKTEKRVAGAIIQTQEDERRKFGSDLHDNVGQLLVSTQLYLGMAANKDYGDPAPFIATTQKYLTIAIDETRNLSHNVFPAFLEEIPLHDAINHLLEGMNPGGELDLRFEYDDAFTTEQLPHDLRLHLYRILQEQLKNIQKYAQATAVQIELRKAARRISLRVSDDGIGFDATKARMGIGLLNMKKRAEMLNGKLLLKTAPGQGCTIIVDIPHAGV